MAAISEAILPLPQLPNWLTAVAASCLAPERPTVQPAKPQVLVVDDDTAVCELLSIYLGQKGLEVATVRTTDGARTLVERGQFDLVILDWRLDGLAGLDLLRLSKARHPDIPVIVFVGADPYEGSIVNGLTREADAVVRKMGPLEALSTAIFKHLDRRQAEPRHAA